MAEKNYDSTIMQLDDLIDKCDQVERGQTTLEDLRNDIGRVARALRTLVAEVQRPAEQAPTP